jgi:two-component system nitrate/nitrite response regulator NarL
VKAVILAAAQKPEDIVAALRAGACGYLCQDISGEQLLRSLELVALGEMVVHPQFGWTQTAARENQATGDLDENNGTCLTQHFESRSSLSAVTVESVQGDVVPSLSRREMLILHMLTLGASNKVIARNLVITESTVKVHMKAILRKLRLQNRTQAAIWARNHVNESDWNSRTASAVLAH